MTYDVTWEVQVKLRMDAAPDIPQHLLHCFWRGNVSLSDDTGHRHLQRQRYCQVLMTDSGQTSQGAHTHHHIVWQLQQRPICVTACLHHAMQVAIITCTCPT